MSTIGTNLTLADWAKRKDPDGTVADIVEILNQTNEILSDAVWVEGNLPTGHRTTVRSDLPEPTWRKLNYGVQPTKSITAQVDETCGMLEDYGEVDKALADLNGNTKKFRLSEDRAHLEGMNQEFASALFYADTDTDPEKILGFAPRYNSLSDTNVVNFRDTGSTCTSIWLVVWDENLCHMIFPKGSKAGLLARDLGEVTLTDANGGRYQGYRTHYRWYWGLALRDWRYVVRIANIDVSDFTSDQLRKAMIDALYKVPNLRMGRPAFYCNKTIMAALSKEAEEKSNVALKLEEWAGKRITSFWGVPLRQCDAILNTETAIS
jgi:hypothetical protein